MVEEHAAVGISNPVEIHLLLHFEILVAWQCIVAMCQQTDFDCNYPIHQK